MSNPTLTAPDRVVPDWTRSRTGPLAPCVICGRLALCLSPARDVPCHKRCAETWITAHASSVRDQRRLIRACTPRGGAR